MDDCIGTLTTSVIDTIINEIKKKKNKDKIMKNIVDPFLKDVATRYYPHFVSLITILTIIVITLIVLVVLISIDKNKTPIFE